MAKFELSIYNASNEIEKKYETDVIRYGILEEAIKTAEVIQNKSDIEKAKVINPIIMSVFPGLKAEELKNADLFDVFNLFKQIMSIANTLNDNSNKTSETKN